MDRPDVIIGAGGHAAVVIEALRCTGPIDSLICLDDDESLHGREVLGVPISSKVAYLDSHINHGRRFIVAVGGGDDLSVRWKLWGEAMGVHLEPVSVIHPTAMVAESARVRGGAFIGAGAIVGARATVEHNAIVNSGAIVEHDCWVGKHSHIAPGAMLAGKVVAADECLVGMGATVRQGVTIGRRAIVGMGAVVTKDVPADAVVVGCPARQR